MKAQQFQAVMLAAVLIGAVRAVAADERESVPPITHEATRRECGECHMAYQPALLPAPAWRRIMASLADHFGDNATLPGNVSADIETYLVANAGRGDSQVLRITGQRWWRHEHDEVRDGEWSAPGVVTRSNCVACHRGAEQGRFDDD